MPGVFRVLTRDKLRCYRILRDGTTKEDTMGIMESLRSYGTRHVDAPADDWRVAQGNGWNTETSDDVEIEYPTEDDHTRLTRLAAEMPRRNGVPDNTAATRRVGNIAPDLFIERRPKADRLVYVLLRQLIELNPDAGRKGLVWYDANRATMTTQAGSDWILRIRAKIAEGAVSAPIESVNAAREVTAPASPWSEFRTLAHEILTEVDAVNSGARFAVENAAGNDNDLGFWVIVNRAGEGQRPMYYLNQYIGGQGPVRVRMAPDAMVTILRRIKDAGPRDAMIRFGLEIGSCGDCGRSLTNATSRREGIGPRCKSRHAWLG